MKSKFLLPTLVAASLGLLGCNSDNSEQDNGSPEPTTSPSVIPSSSPTQQPSAEPSVSPSVSVSPSTSPTTSPSPSAIPGGTTYTISTRLIGSGSISPVEKTSPFDDLEFTLTPESGYKIKSATVTNCTGYLNGNIFEIEDLPSNTDTCEVTVEFGQPLITGIISSGEGSVSPASQNQPIGGNAVFNITAAPFYELDDQFLDGSCEGDLVKSAPGQNSTGGTFTAFDNTQDCSFEVRLLKPVIDNILLWANPVAAATLDPNPLTNVEAGTQPSITVNPNPGYQLVGVNTSNPGSCPGSISGNVVTLDPVWNCSRVDLDFIQGFSISGSAGPNGNISETAWMVAEGETFSFTASPDVGFSLGNVTGCSGTFANNVFTSEPINAACNVNVSFVQGTTLAVTVESPKTLRFSWQPVTGIDEYQLLDSDLNPIATIDASMTEHVLTNVSLPLTIDEHFLIRTCEGGGCSSWPPGNRVALTANDLIAGIATLDPDAAATSLQQAFGHAVAVSRDGSTIAVGAPGPMTGTKETGRVSIWRNNSGSWDRLGDIQPPSTANVFEFGYSLALSEDGSTLVVGAPGDTNRARGVFTSQGFVGETRDSESGAAYVFTYNPAQNRFDYRAHFKADPRNGSQQLDTNNAAALNTARFGHSVAINDAGTRIVVGAPGESTEYTGIYTSSNRAATSNASQGSNSGAVFVYALSASNNPVWGQVLYIKPSDTTAMSRFGSSVAADGDVTSIAVGAPESGGSSIPEKLYVFDTATPTNPNFNWGERGNFNLNGSRNQDRFGSAVAMSQDGGTIAVGAYAAGDFDGAAYIMRKQAGGTWPQAWDARASVAPQGLASSLMNLGYSLGLTDDGSRLLVGARTENSDVQGLSSFASPGASNQHNQAGAAFLFSYDGSTVHEDVLIKAPDPVASRRFGHAAAMSGDASVILIGEPDNALEESDRGRAYLY